jgi:hypothetical protein
MKCSLMDEMLVNLSLKAQLLDNANKDVRSNFLLQNTNMWIMPGKKISHTTNLPMRQQQELWMGIS